DELTQLLAGRPELEAKAAQAAGSLPPLEACADVSTLRRVAPAAAIAPAKLDGMQRKLARARAEQLAGTFRQAIGDARAAGEEAQALGAGALRAEALLLIGIAQDSDADMVAARASFADAAIWAADARDHATLARVASQAMQMEGFVLRFDEADRWARVAAEAS